MPSLHWKTQENENEIKTEKGEFAMTTKKVATVEKKAATTNPKAATTKAAAKPKTTPKREVTKTPQPATRITPARSNNTPWIIAGILVLIGLCVFLFLGLAFLFKNNIPMAVVPSMPVATEAPVATPVVSNKPETCGLIFPAYSGGLLNTAYDVKVDCWQENGIWHMRGWQFRLPPEKSAHSVAVKLPRGNYIFNGVVCRLFLDEERNGQGSSNPMVAGNGNNLDFTVNVDVAYALIECDGGTPSGFDYWSR